MSKGARAMRKFSATFQHSHLSFVALAKEEECWNVVTNGFFAIFAPALVFAYTSPGKPTGFVNDFAQMMTAEARTALEQRLTSFSQETGHEITVVAIPNLNGDTVENYADKLFQEWGIGKKEYDNGVLFLISRDDRKL